MKLELQQSGLSLSEQSEKSSQSQNYSFSEPEGHQDQQNIFSLQHFKVYHFIKKIERIQKVGLFSLLCFSKISMIHFVCRL